MTSARFSRLLDPILARVDFYQPTWQVSMFEARCWLFGSVALDIGAQLFADQLTLITLALSFLTPLCMWWLTSARLVCAIGCLYAMQALGNIALVGSLLALHIPSPLIAAATYVWQAWCLFALVMIILRHIRTPKKILSGSVGTPAPSAS